MFFFPGLITLAVLSVPSVSFLEQLTPWLAAVKVSCLRCMCSTHEMGWEAYLIIYDISSLHNTSGMRCMCEKNRTHLYHECIEISVMCIHILHYIVDCISFRFASYFHCDTLVRCMQTDRHICSESDGVSGSSIHRYFICIASCFLSTICQSGNDLVTRLSHAREGRV